VYGSYWKRIGKHWGERRTDEPTPSDIRQFLPVQRRACVPRRDQLHGILGQLVRG
jgi:integrase/recombinase XerC